MNQIKNFKFIFLVVIGLMFPISSIAAWVDSYEHGKMVYFLFSAPNKIIRYDMASQTLLDDIALDKVPVAFTVSGSQAFVGFHRELYQIDLALGTSQFVRNTSTDIHSMVVVGNYLYAIEKSSKITTVNIDSLEFVDTSDSFYSGAGFVGSNLQQSYFYRTTGVSPSDIRKVTLASDGTIQTDKDSPYHGDYPSATKLYINESENKIYDDSGIIYFAESLTYAGSLAGEGIDALTIIGDNPVALRGDQLYLYDSVGLDQGNITVTKPPEVIASYGDDIFSFSIANSSVETFIVDISMFSLPEPGEPVNPEGLLYQPEFYAHDDGDIVYLVDRESLSVFRWSTIQGAYLDTWPLVNPPTWVTFSKDHNRLYLGYDSGKITYFDSLQETPIEIHFTSLASQVLGLLAAGNYLFTADASGAWDSHYSFDINGVLISSEEWRKTGAEYVWNPLTNRIYHQRDGTSPNDIEWTELNQTTGVLGDEGDSPYHGSYLITDYPLRVSGDGKYVLNGGGQIVDAYDLTILNSLSNRIADAAWINGNLVTIKKGSVSLQFWKKNYELESSFTLSGAIKVRVFELDDQLLLIQELTSGLSFALYDVPNITDSDSDGLHDLEDNCVSEANSSQADFDADGVGDACDHDDDNDSLPDDLEISLGLNPQDRSDADGDLDSDGFSNRVEYLQNSALDDLLSVPSPLAEYSESFDDGWPAGFYGSDNNLEWRLHPYGDGGYHFQSIHFSDVSMSSETNFTALFKNGILSFKNLSVGDSRRRYTLQVLLNGEIVRTLSYYNNKTDIDITEGVHTITLKVIADNLYGNETESYFWIDDFTFSVDSDGDGQVDRSDNCPNLSNRWQDDYDGDGLGDICDNDPRNQDTDEDGYGDIKDNCPNTSNPDQLDIDNDGLGDICDDTDDRPADTDSDGLYDYLDNCPSISNPEQLDIDLDGYGDACDDSDDRPKDVDDDGWYDSLDNCPNIANSGQKDFDSDGVGDLCDDDSDGDGISNGVEQSYTFLDEFDSSDALLDFDNDGVNNQFEIASGLRPDIADDHVKFDLSSYYPLDDIEYTYLNESNYRRITMESTDQDGVYSIKNQKGYSVSYIERRTEGVYLIKVELARSGDNVVQTYNNHLLFPTKIALGETLEIEYTYSNTVGDNTTKPEISALSHQLIEMSEREWQGEIYSSITIRTVVNNGYIFDRVYLKDIGQIEYWDMQLDTIKYKNKLSSDIKKESGGGSLSWFFLMLFAVLLRSRYRWGVCKFYE